MIHGKKFDRAPTIAHGQALLWGGGDAGIQGVTELIDCKRTDDEWLRSVQEEIRSGSLSKDNHAFLHGWGTTVPGSWVKGRATCGQKDCQRLATTDEHLKRKRPGRKPLTKEMFIQRMECDICVAERQSRALVASSANDPRFKNEDFIGAPAIFPNNDLKYDANKRRAGVFAASNNAAIIYSCAKDSPSAEALQERPDLATQKLFWLQRHDRESGDLYGMLPLILGMPVALTDHVDRNADKQLLRGKVGYIHSWVLDTTECSEFSHGARALQKLPKLVMVKFYKEDGSEVSWQLPGLEKGLYPIAPKKGTWYLDKGRMHPVLRITRRQIPLAPAFAMTAHAAQGQTLKKGAVVDLQLGTGANPMASYVAMTRVEHRSKLLIYRPFPREPFCKGERKGPTQLLQLLRGEPLDWEALEAEFLPRAQCKQCSFIKFKEQFHAHQWNRVDGKAVCKQCMKNATEAGTPYECTVCGLWKEEAAFTEKQRSFRSTAKRVCIDCLEKRRCRGACNSLLHETEFNAREWREAGWPSSKRGMCKRCMPRGTYMEGDTQEVRRCRGECGKYRREIDFSRYEWIMAKKTVKQQGVCLQCAKNKKVKTRGVWMCVECQVSLKKQEFTAWREAYPLAKTRTKTTRCNECFKGQQDEITRMSQRSHACVVKLTSGGSTRQTNRKQQTEIQARDRKRRREE